MNILRPSFFFILTLTFTLTACNPASFGGAKKKKGSASSDQEVAQVVCLDEGEGCVVFTCDEIFELENKGAITDENYALFEEAISICHNRSSSDDHEPIHDDTHDDDDNCPKEDGE